MKTGKSLLIFGLLFLSIAVIFLGCSGDSGGDGNVGDVNNNDNNGDGDSGYYCTSQKDYQNSSYELQKTCLHIDIQSIRQTTVGTFYPAAIAYADFDNDGYEDVFISATDGTTGTTPVEIYISDRSGNFTLDTTIFVGEVPGVVNARKALTCDFNGDSLPDIFVIGHGYDQPPFPGEHPLLILSSPNGFQNISGLETFVGFQHGGASADIDGDGDLDIFVAEPQQAFFLINDGLGNFTYDTQRLPNDLDDSLYTAELIDIDEDGFFDLLAAGCERDGQPTTIYWGSSTGTYTARDKIVLPSVDGQGMVVDIDADDIDNDGNKDIVVTRTTPSYVGYYIQIIISEGSRQFTDKTSERIINGTGLDKWIVWIRLQDYNNDGYLDIIEDDAYRNLIWINDGTGVFQ